jgi:DNA-binding CsgD family transcriptional regulator
VDAATVRAARLAEHGDRAKCAVMTARGERVYGHALVVAGDVDAAVRRLGRALDLFTCLDLPYDAARTHLLLAHAFGDRDRANAIAEARAALATYEKLGAATDTDEAAAHLRILGVPVPRGGTRRAAALSPREEDVLALVEQGLTNRQISERLFLSRKTVEHHVRSLLAKLGVANRAEAAAYAVRHRLTKSATD